MKTIRKADGVYVEEPCEAIDVVYAGLAALVEYFDATAPTGPYLRRSFMMCESYCGMLQDIRSKGDTARYQDLMLQALERIKRNSDNEQRNGDRPAVEVYDPSEGSDA